MPPVVKLSCNFQAPKSAPKQKNLTDTRKQELERRIELKLSQAAKLDPSINTQTVAELTQEKLFKQRLIDLTNFQGRTPNKFNRFLAEWLGQFVGKEGQLSRGLWENKRRAENMFRAVAHEYNKQAIKPMNDLFMKLASQHGVDKKLYGQLMTDLFEVGSTAQDLLALGTKSEAVRELLQQRNEKFFNTMLDAGFSPESTEALVRAAYNASETFEALRANLGVLGMNIGKLDNIGYFPRILTSDAAEYMKLNKMFQDSADGMRFNKAVDTGDFSKARTSYWYTLDDHKGLQELLGLTDDELTEAITDTATFKEYIEKATGSNEELLDMMVESGLLSKVPMTSTELYQWYATKYKMPFASFDEVFLSNPSKVLEGYANEMADAAANFGVAKSLKEQGLDKGIIFDTPQEGLVPVSQLKSGALLTRAGVSGYVHPEVGKLIDAVTHIETNPQALHGLASAWRQFTTIFKTQVLTSPQYVGRIFISNSLSYALGGGDIPSLTSAIWDLTKYFGKGLDSFDNVKPYRFINGRNYTHREFIEEFVGARVGGIVPNTDGIKRGSGDWSAVNPRKAGRKIGLVAQMAQMTDNPIGYAADATLKQFAKLSKTLFTPFGYMANILDVAFKLGLMKSVTKTGNATWDLLRQGTRLMTTAEGAAYDTFDDALQHVDRMYLSFDDMGKAPAYVSKNIIPFFSFVYQSSSAILRDTLRNPAKYLTYARVASLVHERLEETNDFTEQDRNALAAHNREDLQFVIYKDERGNLLTVSLTNVHPILGVKEELNKYLKLFGVNFGGSDTDAALNLESGQKLGDTQDSFDERLVKVLEKTFLGNVARTVFGVSYGDKDASLPNTFLGLPMTTRMEGIVRTLAPITVTLNTANPGGIFGKKEQRNDDDLDRLLGKVANERNEALSMFNTRRSDFDNRDLVLGVAGRKMAEGIEEGNTEKTIKGAALYGASQLGLNAQYNDAHENVRKSHKKLTAAINRVRDTYNDLEKDSLRRGVNVEDKLDALAQMKTKLDEDKAALEAFMKEAGILTPNEVTKYSKQYTENLAREKQN